MRKKNTTVHNGNVDDLYCSANFGECIDALLWQNNQFRRNIHRHFI